MRSAGRGGALINVASVLAFLPFPHGGALYAATKAFVSSLLLALWEEQRARGVYVMGLCPGATSTEFFDRAGGDPNEPPPEAIMQTPQQVVSEALHALHRRKKPIVVTGGMNRVFVFLSRLMSFRTQTKIMKKTAPKKR
ncbi:MAG: SDR family NAD(P)-dependent oxidoreductase [Myxococcales bacterium]|nr:MAG: SDR family NAD(P)-dependent oxidoreductase [Myxococcales bacterium]